MRRSPRLIAFLALVLCLVYASDSGAANLLINGDFETGDLTGWTVAGPGNIPMWQEAPPVQTQVYSSDAPMSVIRISKDGLGTIHHSRQGLAPDVKPKSGYSVGWARTGSNEQGYPWISQILRVKPGKYSLDASWDCAAEHQDYLDNPSSNTGAMFQVFKDEEVNSYFLEEEHAPPPDLCRKTTWNSESKGKWVRKEIRNFPIEIKTGYVEIRLWFYDHDHLPPIEPPRFSWAAFDNVSFDLDPVEEWPDAVGGLPG